MKKIVLTIAVILSFYNAIKAQDFNQNGGIEETINYLNNKVNCCRIQNFSFYKNYDKAYDKVISDKLSPNEGIETPPTTYKILDKGAGVITIYQEDDFGKKFESYFYLKLSPDCIQHYEDRVYVIQCTQGQNGIEFGKIFRLLFNDTGSATDFYNALQHLKLLFLNN